MTMETYSILALLVGISSIAITLWAANSIAKKKYLQHMNH